MQTIKFGALPESTRQMTESLRTLKTNIQFCGDDVKTILFTSAAPNEGKSTCVFNLARSLTESDKKVVLIDADMRKSVFISKYKAKVVGQGQILGLSHYLSGQKKLDEVLYDTTTPELNIIFAGPSVPNPTEILSNHYFDDLMAYCRENYDYVLIDCPPMGAAIDAAVIGPKVDGAVLIVAQGQMPTRAVIDAKTQLENSGVRILGAVLSKAKVRYSGYGKYYGSYYGGYYGSYYGNYYGNDEERSSEGNVAPLRDRDNKDRDSKDRDGRDRDRDKRQKR